MHVSVQSELDSLKSKLSSVEREQIPFAASLAINALAVKARATLPGVLERLLDRPRPFTTKQGFFATFSNKANLQAVVGIKDIQAKYLAALLKGGQRKIKPAEQRFMGRYFVPGQAAPLDAYGNVSKTNLVAILKAAESKSEWKGKRIVVFPDGNGKLPAGVYASNKRRGVKAEKRGLTLLLLFVSKAPAYRQVIHLRDEVAKIVKADFHGEFGVALNKAVGSAR